MKAKKIPYYLLLLLLTVGASLIIGFLSFGGMFALWPILPLAFGAFFLSVVYEGEIYLQNIKGALNKLFFKRDYLKRHLANEYLLNHFPDNVDDDKCPRFFKDYKIQLELLHQFGHRPLDAASQARKKRVEKTLADMEKWFAEQLFAPQNYKLQLTYKINPKDDAIDAGKIYLYRKRRTLELAVRNAQGGVTRIPLREELGAQYAEMAKILENPEGQLTKEQEELIAKLTAKYGYPLHDEKLSVYQLQLRNWLREHEQKEAVELFKSRSKVYQWVKAFSAISGLFMGFGTTYLLVGGFATIPLLASIPFAVLPIIILPLAVVAGAAYALLTFNAITDMINNDTIRKWYYRFRDDFRNKITLRNVFMAAMAVVLLTLAVALTICTAGTWWTVAKNARPLFNWMTKIPDFVVGVVHPIITGISALIFITQNTCETLESIDEMVNSKTNIFQRAINQAVKTYHKLRERENLLQLFNPARILLKLIVTPLRILLFLGHLISIGVTADRVPGIPEILSALLGIISEGFEDMHYFMGHDEHDHVHHHSTKDLLEERFKSEHGHNHDDDLPTRLLKIIFSPLYLAAAVWAYGTSQRNANDENSKRPVLSFKDALLQQTGQKPKVSVDLPSHSTETTEDWRIEHTVYKIERFKEKHLNDAIFQPEVAAGKAKRLTKLQDQLHGHSDIVSIKDCLDDAITDKYYNKQRFFGKGNTRTHDFLAELPEQVGVAPAA